MVKNFYALVYLFLISISAQAKAENLAAWIAAVRAAGIELKILQDLPLRVVFLQGENFSDNSKDVGFNVDQFDRLGFFEVVRSRELFWGERVRKGFIRDTPSAPGELASRGTLIAQYKSLQTIANVDILVRTSLTKNTPWEIALDEAQKSELGTLKNVVQFASQPPADPGSSKSIYSWLGMQLGYNGVVMDQKEDRVLVYAAKEVFPSESQAVFYAKSEKMLRIQKNNARALFIAQAEAEDGKYMIFRILLSANGNHEKVPVGTRVFIQSDF